MATRNGVPENLRGGAWKCFGKFRKLFYNYHKLSEDQVTALACYYWSVNNVQCVKLDPLVTVLLDFTAVDSEPQRAKEKQQYCIRSEMIFQIIKNNVPKKYFKLYMVESDRFLFTYSLTRDEIREGVILLKIIINNIKQSTLIEVQHFEDKLASETHQKYENKVLSCTREMDKIYKEIRRLNTGTYDDNRFLT